MDNYSDEVEDVRQKRKCMIAKVINVVRIK